MKTFDRANHELSISITSDGMLARSIIFFPMARSVLGLVIE
jgi:hypothetical protein